MGISSVIIFLENVMVFCVRYKYEQIFKNTLLIIGY